MAGYLLFHTAEPAAGFPLPAAGFPYKGIRKAVAFGSGDRRRCLAGRPGRSRAYTAAAFTETSDTISEGACSTVSWRITPRGMMWKSLWR